MNESDLNALEQELQRLRPAKLPKDYAGRLETVCRGPKQAPASVASRDSAPAYESEGGGWFKQLGLWLVPTAAVCLVAVIVMLRSQRPGGHLQRVAMSASNDATTAAAPRIPYQAPGEVRIATDFVGSCQLVTDSPSGVPIILRVEQYQETVIFRDPKSGVAIERRVPRVELVPVGLASY